MKKMAMTLLLTFAFTIYTFGGITPQMGYAGCEGGLWYPDQQICCMPGLECPVGLSANAPSVTTKDTIFVELFTMLKNIYF